MAIITKGILGGFQGSVGSLIGYGRLGKDIVQKTPKLKGSKVPIQFKNESELTHYFKQFYDRIFPFPTSYLTFNGAVKEISFNDFVSQARKVYNPSRPELIGPIFLNGDFEYLDYSSVPFFFTYPGDARTVISNFNQFFNGESTCNIWYRIFNQKNGNQQQFNNNSTARSRTINWSFTAPTEGFVNIGIFRIAMRNTSPTKYSKAVLWAFRDVTY